MLKKLCITLKKNNDGATAIGFAVVSSILLLGVSAAIDYSFMVNERAKLQSYADAAVLAAAVSGEQSSRQLEKIAKSSILSQSQTDLEVDLALSRGDTPFATVTVKSNYKPLMMSMFGYDEFSMQAVSESPLGSGRKLNLAMVLDTTESMTGSRMDTLKSASTDLLNSIKETAKDPEDVKVSLVPFADYVRIEESYEGQPWLQVQPDHDVIWGPINRDKSTNCRDVGTGELEELVCDIEVRDETPRTLTWIGCMASRKNGYHVVPEYRGLRMQGNAGRTKCNNKYNFMAPLSSDLEAVNAAIQELEPVGRTYIPSGLIWGWRTLDRSLPFDEAKDDLPEDTRDVILLMTDGSNTANLNGEADNFEGIYHWGGSNTEFHTNAANLTTTELCTGAKNSGIEIITVAFEVTDPVTLSLMEACASSPASFYNAENSSQLKSAFNSIGSAFSEVRLSR